MKQRLLGAVRAHGLWRPGQSVAVAVSGGGDSMALLELLVATAGAHRARLEVVTVDHGIHPHSAAWATAVCARAAAHGLGATVLGLGLGPNTSEAAARDARYAALDQLPVERIALAHHRADQAETALLNLVRGTGPRGLAAMPWRRGRYVRPVLDADPAELARWRPPGWVEDPANADPAFLRVRLRTEVLPLLESIRPGAEAAVARSASLAAEDGELLDALAAGLPLTRAALAAAPRPLARRRLHALIGPTSTGVLEAALRAVARGGGRVELDGSRALEVRGDDILILPRDRGDGAG